MPGHPDLWSSCITVMRRAATGPGSCYSPVSGKAVASGTLSPGSGRSPIRICLRYPADVRETPPNPGLQPGVTSTSDPCPKSEDDQSVLYKPPVMPGCCQTVISGCAHHRADKAPYCCAQKHTADCRIFLFFTYLCRNGYIVMPDK